MGQDDGYGAVYGGHPLILKDNSVFPLDARYEQGAAQDEILRYCLSIVKTLSLHSHRYSAMASGNEGPDDTR
jgi:hypothetical protein